MDKIGESIGHTINEVTDLMDQNVRGVQIGCYSVALVGLTVALRRVRPFSKFKKPSDIPDRFIREKRELVGSVSSIEPNGGLLMVQHKPLVNLPLVPSGQLPVKISGIKVSGLGLSWLQAIVAGSEIKFIPVAKDKNYVQCQVLMTQKIKTAPKDPSKKQQPQFKTINVGESLLKIGFATREEIPKPLSEDPSILSYINRLKSAEQYALRKELGSKYYLLSAKEVLRFLTEKFTNLVGLTTKSVAKVSPKIPKIMNL